MKSHDNIPGTATVYHDIHKLSFFVKVLQSCIIFMWRRLRVRILREFLTSIVDPDLKLFAGSGSIT
jgi:hypothetical protein